MISICSKVFIPVPNDAVITWGCVDLNFCMTLSSAVRFILCSVSETLLQHVFSNWESHSALLLKMVPLCQIHFENLSTVSFVGTFSIEMVSSFMDR